MLRYIPCFGTLLGHSIHRTKKDTLHYTQPKATKKKDRNSTKISEKTQIIIFIEGISGPVECKEKRNF